MKDFKKNLEEGFSLLELVVAVGVLLVLTVGGLLAYNGIIGSARQAAVNNAAETVYDQAMMYRTDDKPDTTIQTAVDQWNKSAGIELPENIATINTIAALGVDKDKIIVSATDLEHDSFEIKAVYGNEESSNRIEATRTSPIIDSTGNIPEENTETALYNWGHTSIDNEHLSLAIVSNRANESDQSTLRIVLEFTGRTEITNLSEGFRIVEESSNKDRYVIEIENPRQQETLSFDLVGRTTFELYASMSSDDFTTTDKKEYMHNLTVDM